MSTTPQRYDYGDRIEDPMKECDDGPYILFTDHESDKARAVAEVRRELDDMRRQRDEAFQLSKCQCGTDEACSALYQQQATIARLTKALETIEQWKAFPVITHRGQTSSYAMAYGSNGERDYMRSIAREALKPSP
jgi:hypothetical protein